MGQHTPGRRPTDPEHAARALRTAELRRRIEELEAHDESDFGGFTLWDWLACIALAIAAPAVAVWWFAG